MRHLAITFGAVVLVAASPPPAFHGPRLRAQCDSAGHVVPSTPIMVQGGIVPLPAIGGPNRPGTDNPTALGPKQDDPGPPPSPDLHAVKVGGMGDPAALGPKQDDPGPPPAPELHAVKVGGMGDPAALGPKQDDPGPPPNPDLHASAATCLVQPGGSPR